MDISKLPKGWHEVSVGIFQELHSIETEDRDPVDVFIDKVAVLADVDPDEVKQLPIDMMGQLKSVIDWYDKSPVGETKRFTLNGVEYILADHKALTVGEWIDIEKILEDLIPNIHKLFAILYRPVGKDGKITPYDAKIEERAKLFQKEVMIDKLYSASVFFCHIEKKYTNRMLDSLEENLKIVEKEVKEMIKETEDPHLKHLLKGNLDLLKKQLKMKSTEDGIGSVLSIALQRATSQSSNR